MIPKSRNRFSDQIMRRLHEEACMATANRRIVWLNVVTVISAAILIGAEVFGADQDGGADDGDDIEPDDAAVGSGHGGLLVEPAHDLVRKPVSTFRDHALVAAINLNSAAGSSP